MTTNNNDSNHSRGSNANDHNSRGSNQCHNSHDNRDHQQNGRGGAAGIKDPRIEEWNRNLSAVIHLAEMELQSLGKSAATTVTYFLLYSCLLNK